MRTRLYALLATVVFVACSTSTEPLPQGSGGRGSGGSTSAGGASSGGTTSAGGIPSAGGTTSAGGAGGSVGSGGKPQTGGTSGTGGSSASGGSIGPDASPGSGGSSGTGGAKATGGTPGSGGAGTDGGAKPGTGGSGTGGGGNPGTGGANPGTGGASGAGGGGEACASEFCGASCNATSGALKKNPKLPDPFAMHDGTRISTKAQWECRRAEVKADIEKYEIGPKQIPEKVEATFSGGKLSVVVTTSSGSITLSSTVSGSGSCVVIGMNGNSSMVSGCTQVPFSHDQVVGYNSGGGTQTQSDPFYKVYPSLWGKIGNYNAWSWGISRLIDGIVQMKDSMKVDPTKIAVHGCSYAGKMALFGGAFDQRVALTVAQESGGGGITSWRTSQDFTTRTKTDVEKIDNTNYAWFMSSMKSLDPYSLPHDHHELIAMVAPRAIIALGNPEMEWLGDESGYKSVMAAAEVFKAMGVPENIGYDFTGNHSHCAAAASQTTSVNTFVTKFLKAGTGSTNVAIKPVSSKFDLTYTNDWTTPTLQ